MSEAATKRTDLFLRNADNYIKELVEAGHRQVIWDRGYLHKKRIDPTKHAALYFAGQPFRVIDIGNEEQGAAEYLPGTPRDKPSAVYPVVSMLQTNAIANLEELCMNPTGQNEEVCMDTNVPESERPVFGQDHIIFVTDLPDMVSGRGRNTLRLLRDIQLDYPEATLHIHGLYGFGVLFGFGFKSVDWEARASAQKGKVMLPVGKEVKFEATALLPHWVTFLGFKPSELADPKRRCIYNIKSAQWAADNYTESLNLKFRRNGNTGPGDVDIDSSDADFKPATTEASRFGSLPVLPTDRVHCDQCSLTDTCKVYREGSVCTLDKGNKGLAQMFQTRDSGVIMDGLSSILAKQAQRAERLIADEEEFGELSPEVNGMLNSLFNNGVKFAKLVDPALRSGPKVSVNVGGAGSITVGAERATPQQVMRDVIAALESQGFNRTEITPTMIRQMMTQMYGVQDSPLPVTPTAIEGQVG